jgi:hypothetical protein
MPAVIESESKTAKMQGTGIDSGRACRERGGMLPSAAAPTQRVFRTMACLVAVLIFGTPHAAAQDWRSIRQAVEKHDYDGAIRAADKAVAAEQRAIDQSPDFLSLKQATFGSLLCAKAQVCALKGDFAAANATVTEAESYWYGTGFFKSADGVTYAPSKDLIAGTRGFICEKQGEISQARTLYASRPTESAKNRMALMALAAGDAAGAKKLVGTFQTPTQQIVLGLIARAEKHPAEAQDYFSTASRLIKDQELADKTHLFFPMDYCETVP